MIIDIDSTIYAPATTIGSGAISIIRVSGPDTFEIVDKLVECRNGNISSSKGYTIKFAVAHFPDGTPLDEVLVSVFRSPDSYTGEDCVEISCHASRYIAEQLMMLLSNYGARAAQPGEFTRRAFMNGKMDLAQAESVADLISATGKSSHDVAFRQLRGGFSQELLSMRDELLNMASLMELELDFSEEDVEFADRSKLSNLLGQVISHIDMLTGSFKMGNAIRNGVPVAIVGATNTGKSTLLNALVGEDRAIVSDIAGTTRDTVEETVNIGGIMFRFIDTAGIRSTDEVIEQKGIERSLEKLSKADVVLCVVDLTASDAEISEAVSMVAGKTDLENQKLIVLLNKADLAQARVASVRTNVDSFLTRAAAAGTDGTRYPVNTGIGDESAYSTDSRQSVTADGPAYSADSRQSVTADGPVVSVSIDNTNGIPVLAISAKTMKGITALSEELLKTVKTSMRDGNETLVTNIRHYEALTNAKTALTRLRSGLDTSVPTDLLTQDLREALHHLGTILGTITTSDILNNIFRNFCIGK